MRLVWNGGAWQDQGQCDKRDLVQCQKRPSLVWNLLGRTKDNVTIKVTSCIQYMVDPDAGRRATEALKSPHRVGLFCPYSRSLLTLVAHLQYMVDPDAVDTFYFKLNDPQKIIEAYVDDCIRAHVRVCVCVCVCVCA
jgi:hypothetical protein